MNLLQSIDQRQRDAVLQIAQVVHDAGGRALLVGGFVRDQLMGLLSKDVDIEVFGISAEVLEKILLPHFKLNTVGRSFGVFIINKLGIDIALPRRESKTGPRHTDFEVIGDPSMSFDEAATRRDYTINAISYDPLTQELMDPVGGVEDIERRRLRHVSSAFSEDPLRVLRGMQFVARFELDADPQTVELCQSLTPDDLPCERLWEEWKKLILKGVDIRAGLLFLEACGWLRFFPELQDLVGCKQEPKWHPEGDVWTHTTHCMNAFAKARIGDDWEDLIVGLAVLCHDFGKPDTSYVDQKGRIRSPRHDVVGVPIAEKFLGRLTRQKKVFEEVAPLVEYHMRPLAYYNDRSSDAAIRRLAARVGRMDRLVRVAFADKSGRPPIEIGEFPEGKWLLAKTKELEVADSAPRPIILGRHLQKLGLKPGKNFKYWLDRAFEAQLEGEFSDETSGLRFLEKLLAHEE